MREACLLMNLLLRGGYLPVVIGPEQRLDYVNALDTAQLSGDKLPYESFMAARLDAT